jgi:hypothetical protein
MQIGAIQALLADLCRCLQRRSRAIAETAGDRPLPGENTEQLTARPPHRQCGHRRNIPSRAVLLVLCIQAAKGGFVVDEHRVLGVPCIGDR